MRTGKLARVLLRFVAALSLMAAFIVLDWYPAVKDLGRLRREQGDLKRKLINYSVMAAGFSFPDRKEKAFFAREKTNLRRALPPVADDDGWNALALVELQDWARRGRLPHAKVWFTRQVLGGELGTARPGGPDRLADWLRNQQFFGMWDGISAAAGNFPWQGILSGQKLHHGQLASRLLGIGVMAPLPELLDSINRLSWGDARLEIVRLRLEPGQPLSSAWLVCRGSYLVRSPSGFAVAENDGGMEPDLLIDPDSPLLLQKADPLLAPPVEKRELAPAPSLRGDAAPSQRGEAAGSPR
jgi:hypothetical protein